MPANESGLLISATLSQSIALLNLNLNQIPSETQAHDDEEEVMVKSLQADDGEEEVMVKSLHRLFEILHHMCPKRNERTKHQHFFTYNP
mgnify:CR=1 FL=1|tara:strand:- start:69 stop:335 length:267 start_codon:yes stop_codon:yes gene_type:complete